MSNSLEIERRSIEYVPLSERHGKAWHLWPIWFTGDANLTTIASGAIGVMLGQPLIWAALAVVAGCAFGTFFMAFHSAQGPQLGLPQMIQSRPQFGYRGALLVWVVALVTYVGYNSVNQVLAAQTLHALIGIPREAGLATFTLLSLAVAVLGYRAIHKAQRVLAGIMILVLSACSIGAITRLHFPQAQLALDPSTFRLLPFLLQFFAAASYQLSWSIYVSDYSRYLPQETGVRAAFWWTFVGAMVGGAWMMLVGAVAAAYAPQAQMIRSVELAGDAIHPGFGPFLLAISLLALVTTTSLNFYGGSLTLLSMRDSFKQTETGRIGRLVSIMMVAFAGSFIALVSHDLVRNMGELLAVLLYLFTPWTAVNLVDFYIVRKLHYSIDDIFDPDGIYGRWNWRGLGAYCAGFLAMIPFFSTDAYIGPAAKALGGADISMLVGLPVSAAVYLIACRLYPPSNARAAPASDEAVLEAPKAIMR